MKQQHRSKAWSLWVGWLLLTLCVSNLQAGCLQEASEICGNGGVCPPGLRCANTGDSKICILLSCGNGKLDPGEACDDGNTRSGDGCPADCTPPCGDGVLDPGEACDDGNTRDGDGCSADCRTLDSIFLVSPPMVTFTATEGDALPESATVTVHFAYRGDTVLLGYAPGVPEPTWLSFATGPSTEHTADFALRVLDTSAVGQRSTSVRFVISHLNSTGLDTFDLPIAYNLAPSDLAVQATPPTLGFTAATNGAVPAPQPVNVTFNGTSITVMGTPSWATVSAPPAPVTSPASFAVSIANTNFAAGTALSGDIVFGTTNPKGTLQRTATVHIGYNVEALTLAVEATPASLAFTAATGGAAPAPQTVNVTFNGANITVMSAPSWATVSSLSFPATNSVSFGVSINNTTFAAGTKLLGDIVFATANSARTAQQTSTVHVDYQLVAFLVPEVRFVAPYLGIAGRGGTLHVRGGGFQMSSRPVTIGVGDLNIGPVIPDSDTQITLNYPPLPEGRYLVKPFDPSGITPTAAELVIVTPPPLTYQAIDAPNPRTRIVYDAERQAIYGVDRLDQQIDHFVYVNGTWSALSPHVIPQLTDIAITPNGQSLIVLDQNAINEISLTNSPFALVRRAGNPDTFCGSFFDQVAAADDGKMFVATNLSECSGFSSSYLYDVPNHSLLASSSLYNGLIEASRDGSRVYAGSNGLSPAPQVAIFNSLTNTTSESTTTDNVVAISVSGDASHVILDNSSIYSRSLTLTGNIPLHGVALASRDSSRAFVYIDDTVGAHLEVYDLNAPQQSDALYPLLGTVLLPDSANAPTGFHAPVTMTSSLDDTVVFVSGDSKLLVVPVSSDVPSVQATPTTLAFTALADGDIPPSQAVNVAFNGASITVMAAPSWVTVSAPPDPATSPASFVISVNSTAFAGGTVMSDDIVLGTTKGNLQLTTTVHVDYKLAFAPEVRFVAPYLGIAGQGGTLHVRGSGFQTSGRPIMLSVGDRSIGPLIPDSDTQITLNYPPLPEGRYPVKSFDPPGVAPTGAELVIVTPPHWTYQAIDAPSPRSRIVYDAERQTVYGVNRLDQQIEHFVYTNGGWLKLLPHVIPQLTDITMAPNGRSMIALGRDVINEISLTNGLFIPVKRVDDHNQFACGGSFDQVAAANNGKIFIVFNLTQCFGLTQYYLYDMLDYSLQSGYVLNYDLESRALGASGDGSRIYAGPTLQGLDIFDPLFNTTSSGNVNFALTAISVSDDASRVILQNTYVYSRSLTLIGNVPFHGVALASRDSSRAFVYADGAAGARLEVYDLNGPLQSGSLYPLLKTVMLPDSPNGLSGLHAPVTMTSSLDDAVVFVSGDSKLLVVPVN